MIVLELSTFQKRLKNSFETNIWQQIFIEYKHMIQLCAHTFALDLLFFKPINKRLTVFTNSFTTDEIKNNDKIILECVQ